MRNLATFSAAELESCQHLAQLALAEDRAGGRDLTAEAVVPAELAGRASFVARASGVVAGLPAIAVVASQIDTRLVVNLLVADGASTTPGQRLATVSGPMRSILGLERIALNILQRLSGIASQTRRHVDAVGNLPCKVLDTRKTIPGWRLLEKYAVRQGGGHNHRMGLHDGILIKDNHLAPLGPDRCAAIRQACAAARKTGVPVEVEVESLTQLDAALAERPDIILLDNMSLSDLCEAVPRRNAAGARTELEASGGISLATIRAIAETGVERISVGALTHSAPALDIALDYGKGV